MLREKPAAAGGRYRVPNLERGLRIMELLLEAPQGLAQSDIAGRLSYSKTSVFRITMTLLDYGYLVRDEETRTLRLSRKLLAMGTRALGEPDLMGSALEVMRTIRDATRETVLIGTITGDEMIVLEQVLGLHPFKFSVDKGTRLPLHTSAPAKAILAHLPERERDAALGRIDFKRYNDQTVTSLKAFRSELQSARRDGYALDRGEQLSGIHCVAAPVLDRHGYPVASVWITGPADRIPLPVLPEIGRDIVRRVRLISARLGHGLLDEASHT